MPDPTLHGNHDPCPACELRRLAEEVRERQAELRPAMQRARAERKARRRHDGPSGFVMVDE